MSAPHSPASTGANPAPGFRNHAGHRIVIEPERRRVRVRFNGLTVADSGDVLTVEETGHAPVFYFPRQDVRLDLLTPTDHQTHCPFKGDASYWSITAAGRDAANVAWSYEHPYDEMRALAGRLAFYASKVDAIEAG